MNAAVGGREVRRIERGARSISDALTRRAEVTVGIGTGVFVVSAVVLAFHGPLLVNAQTVANGAFLVAGALIIVRRPGNLIGPLLLISGLAFEVLYAVDAVSQSLAADGRIEAASWTALAFAWLLYPPSCLTCVLILIFPDGRADGRWSRLLLGAMVAIATVSIPLTFFAPPALLPQRFEDPFPHPFLDANSAQAVFGLVGPLSILLPLGALVGTMIAVARLRRSEGIERRQNQWLVFALAVYNPLAVFNVMFDPLGHVAGGTDLVDATGFILLPLAVLIAVMRYRLYEIDRIVTKSVVYLGLAAAVTVVYAGIVVVPQVVLGKSDGDGPGLVLPIAATAVVAVLFEPIRRRLLAASNRLVYGRRSTPHEVLSELTARLAESDTASSLDELARLLAAGTGAETATIWRRSATDPTVEGHWSRTGAIPVPPHDENGDTAAPVDTVAACPIRHGGEKLGDVVIRKAPDDPVSPADHDLIADVAGGAALVLRNHGLNRELERRAVEVRESRRRLIAAQDAERHRLERDLHDGAQQEIVALKVKLGLAQAIAGREGADELATKLADLSASTQEAVDAMRVVARGIYPPLLRAEGLGPALDSLARSTPLSLSLDVSLDRRPPRPVEETVYFCVLDTLNRVGDAGAGFLAVSVAVHGHDLVVELDHDAPAIDLTTLTDRIDAAAGSITERNEAAGDGPAIACRLPASTEAMEIG